MAIIIGCSGSTGSSLLKTILNRHSQLLAGPETCLFAYPTVYHNWEQEKNKILTDITTDGWVIRKGMNLLQSAYGWKEAELKNCIQQSSSFQNFVAAFFAKPLQQQQKQVWIEKTPVNAYGFQAFLKNYQQGKVIQIVRNPYDTIASLMARGMTVYYATGYYVYNTAIATSCHQDPRYYQLKYEDLVATPKKTLVPLFQFLNTPFEENILAPRNEQRAEPTTMKGWQHHETAAVQSSSVGRFQQLSEEEKQLVHAAITSFTITPAYRDRHQIHFANCQELCNFLDYEYKSNAVALNKNQLKIYQWRNKLSRIRYGNWRAAWNYPGMLS